jgi:hypothetical protein
LRSSGVTGPTRERGRLDQRALDRGGRAVVLEQRDQRLADLQLGDRGGDIDAGIGAEGGRGRLDRSLVARGEGAERMLDAVAELARDSVGNIDRVLGDEIDADALGADQADDLLDLVEQRLGRIVEQQMRFVEEEARAWACRDRRPREAIRTAR